MNVQTTWLNRGLSTVPITSPWENTIDSHAGISHCRYQVRYLSPIVKKMLSLMLLILLSRGYLGFTTIILMHEITLITIVNDNWSATMFKAVEGLNNAVTAEDHTVKGRKGSREEGSSKNEARTIISSSTKRSDWMLAKSVRISFQKAVREGIATK